MEKKLPSDRFFEILQDKMAVIDMEYEINDCEEDPPIKPIMDYIKVNVESMLDLLDEINGTQNAKD